MHPMSGHLSVTSALVLASLAGHGARAATAPTIDKEAATPVTNVTTEQLENLPTSTRSVAEMLRTCPAQTIPTVTGQSLECARPNDPRMIDIYKLHNFERAQYGYPLLRWNPALEATATTYAQQLARTGQLVHGSRKGRGIERENVNQGMIGWNAHQMTGNWFNEKPKFLPGIFPNVSRTGNWSDVGHYSQIIWPTTTDIGCGMVQGSGSSWLVCRYSPGGNKDGKPVGLPQASFGVGPARTGLDVNVTSGSSSAPDDRVNRDASTNAVMDQLFKGPAAYHWIDLKTGKPVASGPMLTRSEGLIGDKIYYEGILPDATDPNRAFDPKTGRNFFRERVTGVWKDAATGKPVASGPMLTRSEGLIGDDIYYEGILPDATDPNRAFDPKTGRNFARVPVAAKPTTGSTVPR